MLSLAACNRGLETKEAVRQGVIDHLAARQFNMPGMSVEVSSVKFNGSHADAVVSIAPKGGAAGSGMTMPYQLERKDGKWVVLGGSGSPHPGGMPGSAMPAPGGGNRGVPSPDDLPPAGKK
jgi:hypothetical protein